MTRAEQIRSGKLWQVYPDANPDDIRFEGSRSACLRFIRQNYGMAAWRKGIIQTGQLIWEPEPFQIPVDFGRPVNFPAMFPVPIRHGNAVVIAPGVTARISA